jgi:hypothetical protein
MVQLVVVVAVLVMTAQAVQELLVRVLQVAPVVEAIQLTQPVVVAVRVV